MLLYIQLQGEFLFQLLELDMVTMGDILPGVVLLLQMIQDEGPLILQDLNTSLQALQIHGSLINEPH